MVSKDDLRQYAARIVAKRELREAAARIVAARDPTPQVDSSMFPGHVVHPTIGLPVSPESHPHTIVINVGELTIRAGVVKLSSAEDYSPNIQVHVAAPLVTNVIDTAPVVVNVPEQPAPNITVQQGEVRAIVELPPRPPRTITLDGPQGKYEATVEEG